MADLKKKQIPLRLSSKLYAAIASWAEDDFRSVNGQIEYLLTECVKQRKKDGKYVSETIDEPFWKSTLNNKRMDEIRPSSFLLIQIVSRSLISSKPKENTKHHDYEESCGFYNNSNVFRKDELKGVRN